MTAVRAVLRRIGQEATLQRDDPMLDDAYARQWQELFELVYYGPPRFAEVERVAAKYTTGGQA